MFIIDFFKKIKQNTHPERFGLDHNEGDNLSISTMSDDRNAKRTNFF